MLRVILLVTDSTFDCTTLYEVGLLDMYFPFSNNYSSCWLILSTGHCDVNRLLLVFLYVICSLLRKSYML